MTLATSSEETPGVGVASITSSWSVAQTLEWMDSFRHLVLTAQLHETNSLSIYERIRAADPSRRIEGSQPIASFIACRR